MREENILKGYNLPKIYLRKKIYTYFVAHLNLSLTKPLKLSGILIQMLSCIFIKER